MPGSDFALINISLQPAAAPRQSFGVSLFLETLTSLQFASFFNLSGGSSVLKITPAGWQDTYETIGISVAERAFARAFAHFTGARKPEEAFVAYRGEPTLKNLLTVTVAPQVDSPTHGAVGQYRVNAEGGPYLYDSVGALQVVDITIEDIGGGLAETGTYRVEDADGQIFTYVSGTKNIWETTIVTAAVGVYTVTLEGVAYTYTAGAGDDAEAIRDGLLTDMGNTVAHPGGHPNWVANGVGLNKITSTGAVVGFGFTGAVTAEPNVGDMTVLETQTTGDELVGVVATNLAAAITGATTPPVKWTPVDVAAVITITANAGQEGVQLGIISNGPTSAGTSQVLVTDHRETLTVIRDGLLAVVTAGTHPSFTDSSDGTANIFLDGVADGDVLEVTVSTFGATITDDDLLLSERQSVLELAVAQVSRVKLIPQPATILAFEGTYSLTMFGQTLQHVVGVASGETVTVVRDSLETQVDTLIAQVSTGIIGVDAFSITNNTAGEAFQIAFAAPNSNQAMEVTVTTPVYGIAEDIRRASDDELGWYQLLNGDDTDLAIRVAAEQIEVNIPKKLHGWQSGDAEIRDISPNSATDIGQVLNQLERLRSWGVWHPIPVNDLVVYEAPYSQWAAQVLTKQPGQVMWHGRVLTGFTGNIVTANQSATLHTKRVSFLERFQALDRSAMNGGFVAAGRIIDIIRAMDQLESELTIDLLDLMQLNDILPFTPDGIAQVARVITEVADRLSEQGSVVENSLQFPQGLPRISSASAFDKEQGIMPEFVFTVVVQAGTTRITVTGTVSQ